VGNPSGNALSKDTPIPTSTNAQVASGIVGLQGSNLGATFVGSSGANLPGLIGTPIDNTAATTAPTTAPVGTPTTTPSGGTTAPVGTPTTTPSGGTTAPVGTPTTTPTHSGANSLQPPFALFYKGVAAAIGTGVNMARWAIGK
jgi:hypothetical protein